MFEAIPEAIKKAETIGYIGKVENIVGMSIEASGRKSSIGDINLIYNEAQKRQIYAETVGFKEDRVLLMPYESMVGVSAGTFVKSTNESLKIPMGDFLIGRVIDAMGRPMDGKEELPVDHMVSVQTEYTNPLERPPIREKMEFGVKAIDGCLTIGKGQRMGIFAGSGVGKSTLLGMIAKGVKADINVIALVGERGREVREFLEEDLGPEGLARSVVIVATSDQPAMLRMKCPLVATAVAEYFKNQGKDVLLMMDSLTRFAMAQREIGLAVGEPPIARGYTPSIYAELPKLLERAGNFGNGSITGIYTVLVEGDDTNEPIADTVRGIIDGHIFLSRKLAHANHFPAIDIGQSISRLMTLLVSNEHRALASKLRNLMSLYEKNSDLISIGAYKVGTNPELDHAISKVKLINGFLQQDIYERFSYEEVMEQLDSILK
ncbi:MAG: FliI/YscN family ATPase [Bacillota bacterium]